MNILLLDIETRSVADLKAVGQRRYAKDPSTQITVATWKWRGTAGVQSVCFIAGLEQIAPQSKFQFVEAVKAADRIVAHNAAFDVNVIQETLGIDIPASKVDCTMARAQRLALPGGLDGLAATLGIEGKTDGGRALVMATCKPQRDGTFKEDLATFKGLLAYCVQDLKVLEQIDAMLPLLPPSERIIFERTWKKNAIGLPIDVKLAQAIAARREQIEKEVAADLVTLTGGAVEKVTQRQRIVAWFGKIGYPIDNTRKETIEEELDSAGDNVPWQVLRVLEIIRDAGGSAPTKAQSLLDRHVNGRYLDATRYHGTRSGRGTSEGVNTFNIARPSGKYDVEDVIQKLHNGDQTLDNTALTDALRGIICAPDGYEVVDADLANIELRLAFWYAGDKERLQILADGGDLYSYDARKFFNNPNITKKTHPFERQFGKKLDLSCQYQCGHKRLLSSVKTDTSLPLLFRQEYDETRARANIQSYRSGNPLLSDYSSGLWKQLDNAARMSLANPNVVFKAAGGKVAFCYANGKLDLRLPSGRTLPHYSPYIDEHGDFWFKRSKFGVMMRQKCFGGAWLEILCQASARDVLSGCGDHEGCEGAIEREIPDATLLLDVYDSILLAVPKGRGETVSKQCEAIMSRPVPYLPGLPLGAESYFGVRMKK